MTLTVGSSPVGYSVLHSKLWGLKVNNLPTLLAISENPKTSSGLSARPRTS